MSACLVEHERRRSNPPALEFGDVLLIDSLLGKGGGVYVDGGNVNFHGCAISHNTADVVSAAFSNMRRHSSPPRIGVLAL